MRWLTLVCLCTVLSAHANSTLEFTLHKLESGLPGPTVLVVGGIQGDEPGGFHAASLLVTDYKVTRGNLWVVPNLNFESIIKRSRGVYGDMNRKFASLANDDPDYRAVDRIKALINSPEIDFIINLHDGSGFYRESYVDKMHNSNRWGQSIIIDQEVLDSSRFARVGEYARAVAKRVNGHLLKQDHSYRVHNTKTAEGDEEMEKTLTYFAIRNGKPAIGLEASKNLPTRERVYYHLHMVEALLDNLGVTLQRDFELHPMMVKRQIESDIRVSMFDAKVDIDVASARQYINYFPMRRKAGMDYLSRNPLVALVPSGNKVRVSYGNRRMTLLDPQFFDYDDSIERVTMEIDGVRREVPLGSTATVARNFSVHPPKGYRVNVIGWTRRGVKDEAEQAIERGQILKRFSVDRSGTLYRVEVYHEDKFSGMVLVKFDGEVAKKISSREDEKRSAGEKS
jgi:hypothetical protein